MSIFVLAALAFAALVVVALGTGVWAAVACRRRNRTEADAAVLLPEARACLVLVMPEEGASAGDLDVCGLPVAGRVHWTGENFTDEACCHHLAAFDDAGHRIEIYP